jgi:hypothetical protein
MVNALNLRSEATNGLGQTLGWQAI